MEVVAKQFQKFSTSKAPTNMHLSIFTENSDKALASADKTKLEFLGVVTKWIVCK